jgi:hypothetical protein
MISSIYYNREVPTQIQIYENKRNEIESNDIIFKPPEQVVPKIIKFKPTKEIKGPLNSLENIKKYYVIGDLQDFEDIKPFMENYYNENKNSLNELISKFYKKIENYISKIKGLSCFKS